MNARTLRSAALAALAAIPTLTAAGRAQDFDQLTRNGFKEVLALVQKDSRPVPASESPAASARGVFLYSSRIGQIFFCSASGCREILAAGASAPVSSGKGGLYFTGERGTGFCSSGRCDLLLPGIRTTFALTTGPAGDIWASSALAGYHCTPTACRQAVAESMEAHSNFLNGVYKANGDFLASGDLGTFWCSGDSCRRVSAASLLFVEERCSGAIPADVSYGFTGPAIWRCLPSGCREIGDSEGVDNFASCAFDGRGRIHLPVRAGNGSIACGEECVRDAQNVPSAPQTAAARPSAGGSVGTDGSIYSVVSADDEAPKTTTTLIRRDNRTFDVPAACWSCFPGDEEDAMSPAWIDDCRLIP
ncbi:MAG: hypothetical protein ACHQ51_09905 [Elusimicrobiota bacterium]